MTTHNEDRVDLRAMTPQDIDPMADLVLAGGWSDFRSQFAFAVGNPACLALIAELRGAAVGVGVGTRNGAVGWLGPIFTTPPLRGRGVGRALTAEVARGLEAAGCDALLLAATELGRPLYERLGFVADGRYHVLSGAASALPDAGPALRAAAPGDGDALRALDRWASGEERAHLIESLGAPRWVVNDATSQRLRGYTLATPWGAGPVVAADPEDALALLSRSATVAADGTITAVLPGENRAGRAILAEIGFDEVRSLPRMRRGREVRWHPEAIWRLFSFAMG